MAPRRSMLWLGRGTSGPCIALGAGLFAVTFASTALADDATARKQSRKTPPPDAEITSDTAAQFYEMRSPSGETVIARRRFMTTLGVSVYDLLGKPEGTEGPSLTFRARMRYDADYGGNAEETAVSSWNRLVPGFSRGPIDLMYGYVEGRRFLGGWLGFRAGRQYVTDALGWWSFDGGLVNVTTPWFLRGEVYAGLEQRGGMPLSTPRFERDGVWRGDRTGYDPSLWPSYQPSDVAPAFGVALESVGFPWLHGRATYRRVLNTGASNVTQFADGRRPVPTSYDGTRISQERIGYAFDATLAKLGGLKGGLAYDLYARRMSSIFASVDGFVTPKVTLSLDYDYYAPTFDADSIWNFFLAMPMNDLGARAAWNASDRVSISGGLRGRLFGVQTRESDTVPSSPGGSAQNHYPSSSFSPMGGAQLAARYRVGEGMLGARIAVDGAETGRRTGFDVYGERTLETRYVLQGRAGVWHWDDDLRPTRDATSFGYVAGAGYKLAPRSMVMAELEHNMNRVAGQRVRVMLWLTFAIDALGGAERLAAAPRLASNRGGM